MAANTLINGVAYGWVNITFMGYNVPLIGITALNYKQKQKKENIYTAGQQPNYRGYGNFEYEASVEMIYDQWTQIIDAANGNPLLVPYADMQVIFGSTRLQTRTDVLQASEWLEDEVKFKQGDTHGIVTIPIIIAGILHKVG